MNTFAMVSIMHTMKEVPIVWKNPNWEFFLNTLLNAKVTIRVVVYLCDCESFKFLFMTTMKSTYITKMHFKFG